jgi:hypothetical protein
VPETRRVESAVVDLSRSVLLITVDPEGTTVIKADGKSPEEIARFLDELAERLRTGGL